MNFAAIQKKANPYKGQVRPDGASTTLSVERFFFLGTLYPAPRHFWPALLRIDPKNLHSAYMNARKQKANSEELA